MTKILLVTTIVLMIFLTGLAAYDAYRSAQETEGQEENGQSQETAAI